MRPLNLFCFSFIFFSAAVLFAQDDNVVNVDSSIVVLNASIVDHTGKHVDGLQQGQFRVFEDGVEQEISVFESQNAAFAAVILLDTSGSMAPRITLARSAAIRFLDGLRGNDMTAILTFDSKVSSLQDFSTSRDVTERIFDIKADGMTVLNDAVCDAVASLAKREEKRKAIVVLSDGEDTQSSASAAHALRLALANSVTIYTIDMSSLETGGTRRVQNQGVLKSFAEKTGGFFVSTPGGVAMRDAFKRIVEELGTQYTIGYQPADAKLDGKWHAIELRVSKPNLVIRTRKGYNASKAKR